MDINVTQQITKKGVIYLKLSHLKNDCGNLELIKSMSLTIHACNLLKLLEGCFLPLFRHIFKKLGYSKKCE